ETSLSAIFARQDVATLASLYIGLADLADGDVKVAPRHKFGGGDWRTVTGQNTKYPNINADGFYEPADWDEALCWCVLVGQIDACDPATTLVVYFSPSAGDTPVMRQIAGPKED